MLYLSTYTTVYFCVLAALLGGCFGSFLNCMAWRIVHGESVLKGRSHCDKCGHVLGARDLVPIFSYIAHGGKCRYCGAKLSKRHLWGEIIAAAVFVSALLRYDISLELCEYLLFACILLAASFADLEGYIIPDRFIAAGIAVRLVFILVSGDVLHELAFSAVGGFSVAAALLLIALAMEKLMGREALGGGDVKLIFVTGLYLGWKLNVLCLVFACFIGIAVGLFTGAHRPAGDGGEPKLIPWGPSIAAGAWLALMLGKPILDWYTSLF